MVRTEVMAAPRLTGPEPAMFFGGMSVLGAAYAMPFFWSRGVSPVPRCLFHQLTGQPCPMCGGTRAFVALAHGDIGRAVYFYPLAPFIFLAMLGGIAYGAWALWTGKRIRIDLSKRTQQRIGLIILALFAANWLAKLLWLGFGPLPFPGA